MGRPSKAEHEKRKLVSVRLSPEDRQVLDARAESAGTSLPAEVERRAVMFADADEPTLDLLSAIAAEIRKIEAANKGKRWHRDLRSWGAVAEMLAKGPILDRQPDNEVDREAKEEAYCPLVSLLSRKSEIIGELRGYGIAAREDPHIRASGLGLFGRYLNSRTTERGAIDAIADEDLRDRAVALHSELIALDESEPEIRANLKRELAPYTMEEEMGRSDYRHQVHLEAIDRIMRSLHTLADLRKATASWPSNSQD